MEQEFFIDDIESIEQIDDFNNEYVYDIEVDDNHMFFGNNILLHNSIYVEFGRLTQYFNIPWQDAAKFVVNLWNWGVGPYMERKYEEYAKNYQCKKNLEVLELEKVARTTILFAKKHYVMEEDFAEPDIYLEPLELINYKGLEVIQGSTPPYIRKCMKDFYEFVLKKYVTNQKPSYNELIDKLKKYKADMQAQSIEDISKTNSCGSYEKWIRNDRDGLIIEKGSPIHVRGAAYYNHDLYNNKKFMGKYSRIKSGDKIKFYYAKGGYDVYSFLPFNFPGEFAPPVDYDTQFEKLLLTPLNKVIKILGYQELSSNLCFSEELW